MQGVLQLFESRDHRIQDTLGSKFYFIVPHITRAGLAPVPISQKCSTLSSDALMHTQVPIPGNHIPLSRHLLCTGDFIILQPIVLGLQPLERFLSVLGQIGLPVGSNRVSKESWLPVFVLLLPLRSLVTLPFLNLLLELGRFRVLLALYGPRDAGPETLRFIRKLLIERGNGFGGREKGSEVQ